MVRSLDIPSPPDFDPSNHPDYDPNQDVDKNGNVDPLEFLDFFEKMALTRGRKVQGTHVRKGRGARCRES